MEKWKEEFDKLEICCDDCCDHERENRPGVETRVRDFIEKVRQEAIREVIETIPDRLEYYREIATTNKLKNDWDMTQLKDQLKAKFL